jgi:hypothetical protein
MKKVILFITLVFVSILSTAQDIKTHIPERAITYLPMLVKEQTFYWTDMPKPWYNAALIEHESGCFYLKKMCWSPSAKLKTSREEGAGFGQITRTFNYDGSQRFDSLYDLRRSNKESLKELSWNNVYSRPDLQLRSVVLKVKQDYNKLHSDKTTSENALLMTDAAYNAGRGRINIDRRICASKKNCDPNVWFNNVASVCSITTRIYNRSACDIYHNHAKDTFIRTPKYETIYTKFKDKVN